MIYNNFSIGRKGNISSSELEQSYYRLVTYLSDTKNDEATWLTTTGERCLGQVVGAEFLFVEVLWSAAVDVFSSSSLLADTQRATTLPIPRVVSKGLPIPRFTLANFYRNYASWALLNLASQWVERFVLTSARFPLQKSEERCTSAARLELTNSDLVGVCCTS